VQGYGIHGTNEPKSIGKAASHGCIRMAQADLEEFYELVTVGDAVQIVAHTDAETAKWFAPARKPAETPAPMLLAQVDPSAKLLIPEEGLLAMAMLDNAPAIATHNQVAAPAAAQR
jgi:hypothetical protein